MEKTRGYTMMEVLLVTAIIVLIASITLGVNIKNTLQKTRDTTRKQDLNKLARIFEDYYNDHSRYPTNDPAIGIILNTPWGTDFPNYPIRLPKDPLSPNRNYYYETNPQTQEYFALYAFLENTSDTDITLSGCQAGCGPNPIAYNYVVHSPNVQMISGVPSGNAVGYPGFGQPSPTPTSPPAPTDTPVPTINLTPPPVIGGNVCGHHECCINKWCGAPSTNEGGTYCFSSRVCTYESSYYGWQCLDDTNPPTYCVPSPTP